ncbi:glutamate carboxypeptidase [Sphingorhabdus rigui]|uniref:Glutamate carboxypeptidase n=1 Tax=Sphingorhabdus rigui TaxID=1282858 RepID=A0A840B3C1_9SPHN|nr:hydrolase [Sphingorhabdus rigui]MBB3943054.1 glutamate carboxypeptidase [Sphingorhabdus rigui]
MHTLSASERQALETIEQPPMLAQVQKWAAINSGSGNLDGLATTADLLADAFSTLPGELTLVEPEPVDRVLYDGTVTTVAHGRHLLMTVRPECPTQLLFTGHMDTVFPADHHFQTLRWLDDGTLNGPGVADMKGGIAVMLAALKAAESSGKLAQTGYQILINSDEEVGSPSSAKLIAQLAQNKLAALTYEPALPDGTLAGERGGSGNFSIIIAGKSAHAGRNPDDGRNALLAAADLALQLKRLSREGLSVNPAKIDGGGPNNVVPDHAILRVNFRPRTPEIAQQTDVDLRRVIADIEREHDVRAHLHGSFGRPPKPIDDEAAKLFGLVKQCGADLGITVAWRSSGGVCDGNNIAACGVPVVDTMGVRGGSIHSSDEFLIVESLVERAQLSALTIMRLSEKGTL